MPIGFPATTNGTVKPPKPTRFPYERLGGFGASRGSGYGGGSGTSNRPILLPHEFDDLTRELRMQVYEWMLCDAIVASSLGYLKQGVLSGPLKVTPAVQPDPGQEPDADAKKASEIADFLQWNLDRLDIPLPDVLDEWLDALAYGCVLSEKIYARELVDGKRVLKALKPKPYWSWKFKVDRFGEVLWIEPADRSGDDDPGVRIPRQDVAIFTWAGKRGDPRGTSLLRPAYQPWNSKRQSRTDYGKFLRRHASPTPIAKAPLATMPVPPAADGSVQDIFQFLLTLLKELDNSTCAVLPATTEVDYLEPKTEGGAFLNGFSYDDRQIATAILGSSRAIMEAEFGSRADSESSQDIAGQFSRFLGAKLSRTIQWEVLYPLVVENWGPEVADKFTPTIPVGAVEHQDKAALIGAWTSAGWTLHEKHLAKIDAELELDPRTEEDILAEEEKAAEKAAAAGLAKQGPPGAGGAKGKAGDAARPPATFAYDALPDEADLMRAARSILSATFPSAAAYRRWQAGETSAEDRRTILGWIVDDAKARLTAEGRQLLRGLAVDPAAPVQFASPWGTVARWKDGVAKILREFYLAGALALLGPAEFTPADWETFRREVEVQVDYLDGFAGDVMTEKQPRDGTMGSRSGLYGQSVWAVAHAMERDRARVAGMTEEKRVHSGPDRPCSECAAERAKKWQPIGTLKAIGACLCMTGCHCHFEFRGAV